MQDNNLDISSCKAVKVGFYDGGSQRLDDAGNLAAALAGVDASDITRSPLQSLSRRKIGTRRERQARRKNLLEEKCPRIPRPSVFSIVTDGSTSKSLRLHDEKPKAIGIQSSETKDPLIDFEYISIRQHDIAIDIGGHLIRQMWGLLRSITVFRLRLGNFNGLNFRFKPRRLSISKKRFHFVRRFVT